MTERRVTFFLEDTELTRPNRIALAQADALTARGFAVRIVTKGQPQVWRSSSASHHSRVPPKLWAAWRRRNRPSRSAVASPSSTSAPA